MVESIYIWVLFVIVCIIVLIPTIIFCSVFFDDNDDEAGNFSYLIALSALLMGLFPLVGSLVMEVAVLTRVYWIAEAVSLLCS